MIYLDNASTTFPKPEEVYEALDFANRNQAFNAGRGESKESQIAFDLKEEARKLIGELGSVSANKVIFTASATDAMNLILFGLDLKEGDNVYISPFEHNATCRPLNLLKNKGINVNILKFNEKTWEPDLENIENSFAMANPNAVIISEVSNVTGYEIPYEEIFKLSKQYNAINVIDAAQSFGVISKERLNADFLVFAGHKTLYGSFGIGGLINYNNIELKETRAGGTGSDSLNLNMPDVSPYKYEYGSPNVIACASLIASINWIKKHNIYDHEKELTTYLISELSKFDNIHLFLPNNLKQHNSIVSFVVDGYDSNDVGTILNDEFDISLRTGFHCAPLVHDFIKSKAYNGTIRVSIGFFNKKQDVDSFIQALRTL